MRLPIYPIPLDGGVKFWIADPASNPTPLAQLASLDAGKHAQFAFLGNRTGVRYWLRTSSQYAYYDPEDDQEYPTQEFVMDESVTPAVYQSNCPVVLGRGVYRQFFRFYSQTGHIASAVAAKSASDSKGDFQPKLLSMDCIAFEPPGAGGITDMSTMTPQFTPATALRWTVNF